jgi:hypothetical protein
LSVNMKVNFIPQFKKLDDEDKAIALYMMITMQMKELASDYVLSSALYTESLTFVIPPGEPYSDLERMFAAFDDETWIGIGATFAVALITIRIISLLSVQVKRFVFGAYISTPTLNLFDIFINGGQDRVPTRNFARYLLTMFTIWSLIFRTCYQSMMFDMLRKDMRHPQVKTIEELKEKNFTLVYYDDEAFDIYAKSFLSQ